MKISDVEDVMIGVVKMTVGLETEVVEIANVKMFCKMQKIPKLKFAALLMLDATL